MLRWAGKMPQMPKDFNLGLVFLSYLVAVTASHVTLLLAARVRDPHATNWKLWVVSGGFAMGIGIWSMHFVATLALKLPIRVLYDLSLTALSWLFAIGACSAAFIILRRLTGKQREFLLPGALIGIGIASMHYTGDASMRLSPGIRYDPVLFVASILIAMGAATAALWIAFHLAKQRAVFTNFGAALVMGAAVVGMHFTAVAAANFHPESICLASGPRLDEEWMAYTIGGFTFVILTATMLLSAYDARLSSAIAGGAEKLRHGERAARAARARAHPDAGQRGGAQRRDPAHRARLHRLDGCPRPHRGVESGGGAHLRLYAPGSARPRARRAGDRPRALPRATARGRRSAGASSSPACGAAASRSRSRSPSR